VDEPDRVLWHLIAGTRGGPTRLQIMAALSDRPLNANQLTSMLGLDYKTVRHHLDILVENGLVVISEEKKYGELYHLVPYAKERMKAFQKILDKL
jgi:DNA-binding transcriptional ArsR family regulator